RPDQLVAGAQGKGFLPLHARLLAEGGGARRQLDTTGGAEGPVGPIVLFPTAAAEPLPLVSASGCGILPGPAIRNEEARHADRPSPRDLPVRTHRLALRGARDRLHVEAL